MSYRPNGALAGNLSNADPFVAPVNSPTAPSGLVGGSAWSARTPSGHALRAAYPIGITTSRTARRSPMPSAPATHEMPGTPGFVAANWRTGAPATRHDGVHRVASPTTPPDFYHRATSRTRYRGEQARGDRDRTRTRSTHPELKSRRSQARRFRSRGSYHPWPYITPPHSTKATPSAATAHTHSVDTPLVLTASAMTHGVAWSSMGTD